MRNTAAREGEQGGGSQVTGGALVEVTVLKHSPTKGRRCNLKDIECAPSQHLITEQRLQYNGTGRQLTRAQDTDSL